MNNKTKNVLNILLHTVLEVLFSLAICFALCIIAFVILHFGFKTQNPLAYELVWALCFIAGLFTGVWGYNAIVNRLKKRH